MFARDPQNVNIKFYWKIFSSTKHFILVMPSFHSFVIFFFFNCTVNKRAFESENKLLLRVRK